MLEVCDISLSRLMDEIGIDEESITELLSIYCSEMEEEMQQVRRFLHNQDWVSLQRTIHNIKGVSANLSLQHIFAVSAEIDLLLKNKEYINMADKVQNLLNVLTATIKSIKKALEQDSLNSNRV